MYESLRAAERKARRLRLGFTLATLGSGVLAVMTLTIVTLDLALGLAWFLADAHNVLPVTKAVLSTLAAVVGIYLVAVPLYRNLPLKNFVRYLERRLNRESYILTACELLERQNEGSFGEFSPYLIERVGNEALEELRPLSVFSLPPFNILFYTAIAFTLFLGASLVTAMTCPETMGTAMTKLVSTAQKARSPVEALPGKNARPEARTPQPVPPCRGIEVAIWPPSYFGTEPFTVGWGNTARIMVGSTLEVTCQGPLDGETLVLEQHTRSEIRRFPFEPTSERVGAQSSLTAGAVVLERSDFFVAGRQHGTAQQGKLSLAVVADSPPTCAIVQPGVEALVKPTGTVTILVEAADDVGISAVTVRHMVEGIDSMPTSIELARPDGQKRVLCQRDLPVTSFGADPSDRIVLFVEVADTNSFSGPSVCTTEKRHVTLTSRHGKQRELIENLARLRDSAVMEVGMVLTMLENPEPAPETSADFEKRLAKYVSSLEQASAQMGSIGLFRQEDTRRVAALAAAVEEIAALAEETGPQPARIRALFQAGAKEFEQHAVVLDGVVEKLLGEYLFFVSGRVQSEVNRLLAIKREAATEAGGRRAMSRGFRKLNRIATRAVAFRSATQPEMPRLFSMAGPHVKEDWFGRIATIARELAGSSDSVSNERWKLGLESLSVAAEKAAQSVEGAYAQSMSRLSSSFRSAQTEMIQRLEMAMETNQAITAELEALVSEVQLRTKDYKKRRKTMEAVRSVARRARALTRVARRFRAATYLKVERKQVVEFREKLAKLAELVALLKLEEATVISQELVALTQSMEFSLKLPIKYSDDKKLVRRSRKELGKVKEARKLAEIIAARLSVLRPQRKKLLSLRSEKLEQIGAKLDKLQLQLSQIREKMEGLKKTFPIFFGRFGPALEGLAEALGKAKIKLSALMLEDTHRLTTFMGEAFAQLLDTLKNAAQGARTASALVPGGAQPALDIEGKGKTVSREKLERFMKLGTAFGDRQEWQEVIGDYFTQLSQ